MAEQDKSVHQDENPHLWDDERKIEGCDDPSEAQPGLHSSHQHGPIASYLLIWFFANTHWRYSVYSVATGLPFHECPFAACSACSTPHFFPALPAFVGVSSSFNFGMEGVLIIMYCPIYIYIYISFTIMIIQSLLSIIIPLLSHGHVQSTQRPAIWNREASSWHKRRSAWAVWSHPDVHLRNQGKHLEPRELR